MYTFTYRNRKIQRLVTFYTSSKKDIIEKLERLQLNPRWELSAHPLYGHLTGQWSCWLGSNLRMIYTIDDEHQLIIIQAIGTHKIY